jgi:hypothetical protein
MLYESLYNLLESVSNDLPFDNEFQHGRGSDINIFADNNRDFLIWLSPMRSTGTFPNQGNRLFNTYNVELAFYHRDEGSSTNEVTRNILELTDKASIQYLLDLNQSIESTDTIQDSVTIESISREPFIKVSSHILTGILLTFRITLPDDFKYC